MPGTADSWYREKESAWPDEAVAATEPDGGRHHSPGGNGLRAAVFGASDGKLLGASLA